MHILDNPWSLQLNLKQVRQSGILQNGVDYRKVDHLKKHAFVTYES